MADFNPTHVRSRLDELRRERTNHERQIEQLDRKREDLQNTLLRIKGAIQVLEELLETSQAGD